MPLFMDVVKIVRRGKKNRNHNNATLYLAKLAAIEDLKKESNEKKTNGKLLRQ